MLETLARLTTGRAEMARPPCYKAGERGTTNSDNTAVWGYGQVVKTRHSLCRD